MTSSYTATTSRTWYLESCEQPRSRKRKISPIGPLIGISQYLLTNVIHRYLFFRFNSDTVDIIMDFFATVAEFEKWALQSFKNGNTSSCDCILLYNLYDCMILLTMTVQYYSLLLHIATPYDCLIYSKFHSTRLRPFSISCGSFFH